MTMSLVALCADPTCLQHPEAMGLAGENLASQEWLRLFSTPEEARRFLGNDTLVDEVWVVSSEGVSPINLAASLKRDRPERVVCLVSFQETGSLKSRASAAGIDASLTRQAFVARYARRKQAAALRSSGGRPQTTGFPCASGPSLRVAEAPAAGCAPTLQAGPAAAAKVGTAAAAPCAAAPAFAHDVGETENERGRFAQGRAPALARESRRASAFFMPVASGSGGAGKSTVAALAAILSQGLGFDTLLVDFDLQFGDMPALLGVRDPVRMEEVLEAPGKLSSLRPEKGLPALLAAPKRLEDSEVVVGAAPQLLDQLSQRFDVVICNTGAAWAEQHAILLERSSKALLLVDQRASSLRACKHALDLCARCGIATNPFVFALNRCAKGAPLTSIDVSCALQGAHVAELKDGGRDVEDLLGSGVPFELLESRNDLCTSLERLMLDLLPGAEASGRGDDSATRAAGRRLLKGRAPRRRKRGAPCL
ncbi:MAG TPA: chromosome partitioning protein ParA [Candidatus Rubneribacter avistercoris]|nr:chromosome partitioning protein ParA [Candidatus Rubneribacter avistercoris]